MYTFAQAILWLRSNDFVASIIKKKSKFGLYIVSLLLNCKNLKEATEILQDISVTLRSQNITVANRPFIDRLLRKK